MMMVGYFCIFWVEGVGPTGGGKLEKNGSTSLKKRQFCRVFSVLVPGSRHPQASEIHPAASEVQREGYHSTHGTYHCIKTEQKNTKLKKKT